MPADYNKQVLMMGNYNGEQVQIACDSDGGVLIIGYEQQDVAPDTTEAQTWDTAITSLTNNLNRIRYQIKTITGEAWGTVSHSIAAVWAKFHETTGHKHTAVAGDGPQLDHGLLGGLTDDDHAGYFNKDGSKPMSGYINRNVNTDKMSIYGGLLTQSKDGAALHLYGADSIAGQGSFAVWLPNAAKSAGIAAITINGVTDTPTPVFAGLKRGAAASKADGGTITHGCGTTPISVVCTASVAGEIISVTALGATTFTVAIKKHDGTAGTTQTVYWIAWL